MDDIEVNVDFIINNPALQAAAEQAEALITGVGVTAEETAIAANAAMAQIMPIADMRKKVDELRRIVSTSTDVNVIRDSNSRIQELESNIARLSNVGREGFDSMGNAIERNRSFLGKLWGSLGTIANILPGLGIAGLLGFALDPIIAYLSKLDLFKEKLNEVEKTNKSLGESLASGGDYAKAVISISSLRINLDLARQKMYDKTKVVDEYNKSVGAVAGQVKSLDEVEQGLTKNADSYIKMTLFKAAANKALEEASSKVIAIEKERLKKDSEEVGAGNKILNALTAGDYKNQKLYEKSYKEIATKNRKAAIDALETEKQSLESIAKGLQEKAASEAAKMGGVLGLDKSAKTKNTASNKAVDAAESLQRRVLEITEEYSRKSKTKDEEELQALRDKFAKIADEVLKFNRNPKNKIKVDGSGLEAVRESAITDLKYRQDTEKLKVNLEEQKRMYAEYEAYKKDFGEERAKERFANELDLNKTFTQSLESQLAELNGKATLTGAETERKKALEKLLADARLQELKQNDENFKSALETAKTYSDKLLEIEKDFQKKKASLQANKSDSPERIAELERQKAQAIEAAKDEALQKTAIYKQLAVDTLEMTRTQVQAQIKIIDELLKQQNVPSEIRDKLYAELSRLKVVLNIGVDEANLQALQERYQALIAELSMKDSEGKSIISDAERKRILAAIAEIRSKIKGIDVNADGKATWADKLAKNFEYLKGTSTEIANGLSKDLGDLAGSFGQLSNSVGGMNTQLGTTLNQLGNLIDAGAKAAKSFASFSAGDFIGGFTSAIGAVTSIIGLIQSINTTVNKQIEDFYYNAIKGEQEYQDLLKQRSLELVRENKTTLDGLTAELNLRRQNLADYATETADILQKVASMSYKIRWIDTDGLNNIWGLWKSGFWEKGSLAGKTVEELSLLLKQGALDDDAKALVERLVELEQKGFDATQVMKDLAKQVAELFTGTTASSLTDSLVQLFEQGKTSAQDFADFFEKAMSDAALSIFKNKILAEAMNKFYADFSNAVADGGLSKDEISSLNTLFSSLMSNATQEFDMLKQATGLSSLGTSSSSAGSTSAVGTIARSITEQTGSELVGLGRSMYDTTKRGVVIQENSLSVLRENLLVQYAIQANTANTVTELKSAVTELKAINSNTKPNSSAYDRGF